MWEKSKTNATNPDLAEPCAGIGVPILPSDIRREMPVRLIPKVDKAGSVHARLFENMVKFIVMKSDIGSTGPQGADERIDTEEAKYARSKAGRLRSSWEDCCKNIALSGWMPSGKKAIKPTRANPHAKTEEPIGAKLWTGRKRPKCPSWDVDDVGPDLEKPLRNVKLPIWDLSKAGVGGSSWDFAMAKRDSPSLAKCWSKREDPDPDKASNSNEAGSRQAKLLSRVAKSRHDASGTGRPESTQVNDLADAGKSMWRTSTTRSNKADQDKPQTDRADCKTWRALQRRAEVRMCQIQAKWCQTQSREATHWKARIKVCPLDHRQTAPRVQGAFPVDKQGKTRPRETSNWESESRMSEVKRKHNEAQISKALKKHQRAQVQEVKNRQWKFKSRHTCDWQQEPKLCKASHWQQEVERCYFGKWGRRSWPSKASEQKHQANRWSSQNQNVWVHLYRASWWHKEIKRSKVGNRNKHI